MSKGPCLCGDPYCVYCGDPELAAVEAAEVHLLNVLAEHRLNAAEYHIVLDVGLAAVQVSRLSKEEADDGE